MILVIFQGGHNLWDYDYLQAAPVSDVSILMHGEIATVSHWFLNEQWSDALSFTVKDAYQWKNGRIRKKGVKDIVIFQSQKGN